MTEEDKKLLFIDLCARLPYGVKFSYISDSNMQPFILTDIGLMMRYSIEEGHVKPYLRSINSMTEDEKKEWIHLRTEVEKYTIGYHAVVDFYNAHHFDYRGLLYDDLAIEAPEWMYNFN